MLQEPSQMPSDIEEATRPLSHYLSSSFLFFWPERSVSSPANIHSSGEEAPTSHHILNRHCNDARDPAALGAQFFGIFRLCASILLHSQHPHNNTNSESAELAYSKSKVDCAAVVR